MERVEVWEVFDDGIEIFWEIERVFFEAFRGRFEALGGHSFGSDEDGDLGAFVGVYSGPGAACVGFNRFGSLRLVLIVCTMHLFSSSLRRFSSSTKGRTMNVRRVSAELSFFLCSATLEKSRSKAVLETRLVS